MDSNLSAAVRNPSVVYTKKGRFTGRIKLDNTMTVPICKMTGDVIQPLMKAQWWMKMDEMVGMALKVVQDGDIEIRPETAKNSYFRGHRIPAHFIKFEGEYNDTADNAL
ncbi:hypothetical protein BJX99DRAFT_254177 [Aspergillus californicus]